MKLKTGTIVWLVVGFIWSIFMGVTAVSIGLGSMFPQLDLVAKPFVCPNGEMRYEEIVSNPLPGTTYSQTNWYCVDDRTEQTTPLGIFPMSLYAGVFYGLLIFGAGLAIWYFYSKWDPTKASEADKKRVAWIQGGVIVAIVVGLTLFNLTPLIRSMLATPEPTLAPDATATALASTFEALTSGAPSDFNSTDKPLDSWKGIPIMPEAIAGEQVGADRYTYNVKVDSGTIATFYSDQLKPLGWTLEDTRWLGQKFTKGEGVLLVVLAPASDTQSWVVTLVRVR